jgi:hypothetical protein
MQTQRWPNRVDGQSRLSRRVIHLLLTAGVITLLVATGQLVLRSASSLAGSRQLSSQTREVQAAQHVRFTIYPEGIQPAMLKVREGAILISIEDLAGASQGILVERTGEREPRTAGKVERFERHWRGRSVINLSAGVYRLRVPGMPTNEAQLIVTP